MLKIIAFLQKIFYIYPRIMPPEDVSMEKILFTINNDMPISVADLVLIVFIIVVFAVICFSIVRKVAKSKKVGIFLSYSHSSELEMSKIKKIVSSANDYEIYDFDSISVGQDIQMEIKRMIDISKLFIVLFDEYYVKSSYCSMELDAIISSGKPVIPVIKSNECALNLPPEISKLKYLIISDDASWEKTFEESLHKQVKLISQADKLS